MQRAVADWNAREPRKIHYVADPELAADRATLRFHVHVGSAGAEAVVAVLDALGAAPAVRAIARCIVGRRGSAAPAAQLRGPRAAARRG